MAPEGEDAIHRQAEQILAASGGKLPALRADGLTQGFQPLSGHGGNGKDGRTFQEGSLQKRGHVLFCQFQQIGVDHVDLGQRHHAVADAEQRAYFQMFAGLGHDALVRSDDQQHKIDARRSGHHVAHKAFMARHIHHAHALAVGQGEVGEAQFNGNAPALFLRQAVRIGAGERLDQNGFAVIYMARRADDDVFHEAVSRKA